MTTEQVPATLGYREIFIWKKRGRREEEKKRRVGDMVDRFRMEVHGFWKLFVRGVEPGGWMREICVALVEHTEHMARRLTTVSVPQARG